jgi:hypothetical protein
MAHAFVNIATTEYIAIWIIVTAQVGIIFLASAIFQAIHTLG